MRVISGTARGVKLRPPSGAETRPLTDRAKESLFDIILPQIPDCRFLDLFAGTGAVGIEALSRGASHATFVELSKRIYGDLSWNLEHTRLAQCAVAHNRDAFQFLRKSQEPPFDVIFVSPPQWRNLCQYALDALCKEIRLLAPGGMVITQHDPRESVRVNSEVLTKYRQKLYGNVQFDFYKRPDAG